VDGALVGVATKDVKLSFQRTSCQLVSGFPISRLVPMVFAAEITCSTR